MCCSFPGPGPVLALVRGLGPGPVDAAIALAHAAVVTAGTYKELWR